MNYENLFSFVVFSEHLSFTKAARAMAISQPALFVQVKKLTESVGVPLYVREGEASRSRLRGGVSRRTDARPKNAARA